MRVIVWLSSALLLGLGTCATGEMSSGGSYRGQILDADTGSPLAGVLVVFIWYRDVYSSTTGRIIDEFHAATEVRSGDDGYFEVSTAPEACLGSSAVHVQSPGIIFFLLSYVQDRIEVKPGAKRFRDPTRIYMKRVKNPVDALDLGLAPSFPYDRTPLLLKTLNQERARLGLPLIQPGNQ